MFAQENISAGLSTFMRESVFLEKLTESPIFTSRAILSV